MSKKLNEQMSALDMIMALGERNMGALHVLQQMVTGPDNLDRGLSEMLALDELGISGSKIWVLYKDCCGEDIDKFHRTMLALTAGAYSKEDIFANLNRTNAIPFLIDGVGGEDIPSYQEKFGPTDKRWVEYIEANKKVVLPRIYENYREF